jgi:UDP-N-acetylglucosamine 2-epimerase (non-hydrolysing)
MSIPTVRLMKLIGFAGRIARRIPVIFPVHPRTRRRLDDLGQSLPASVLLVEPQPYITFLGLLAGSKLVLTDSGRIQEKTTALRVPCLTLRPNTERPSTVDLGTNAIVGDDLDRAYCLVGQILRGDWKEGSVPLFWDGHATARVADVLLSVQACSTQAVATF